MVFIYVILIVEIKKKEIKRRNKTMTDLTIIAYINEMDDDGNAVEGYTIAAESQKQNEKEK